MFMYLLTLAYLSLFGVHDLDIDYQHCVLKLHLIIGYLAKHFIIFIPLPAHFNVLPCCDCTVNALMSSSLFLLINFLFIRSSFDQLISAQHYHLLSTQRPLMNKLKTPMSSVRVCVLSRTVINVDRNLSFYFRLIALFYFGRRR
jgi:hypothetical protein